MQNDIFGVFATEYQEEHGKFALRLKTMIVWISCLFLHICLCFTYAGIYEYARVLCQYTVLYFLPRALASIKKTAVPGR